jgi:hypothetical protein
MELDLHSKEGYVKRLAVPPTQWDSLWLPSFDFPRSTGDSLRVQVKVWDRLADGSSRATPALSGGTEIEARDAEVGKSEISLRLVLQVPESEYDR